MNAGPGLRRRCRQPARIAERLDAAAPLVDPAADIEPGAHELIEPVLLQDLHIDAALGPLPGAAEHGAERLLVMGRLYPALADGMAVDCMFFDQGEHQIRPAAGCPDDFRSEVLFQLVRIVFQAGDDLPAVPPGSAPARLMGFQDQRLDAGFRQMQRGRQPGEAAAHDHDIGLMHALQPGIVLRRSRGRCP